MEQTTHESAVGTDLLVQPALQRLARLAELPADWDSYGAAPPSPRAVSMAREILSAVDEQFGHIVGEHVQPYAIAPIADGGVQIEWRGPRAEIEVEIDSMGQPGYLLIDKGAADRTFQERDTPTRAVLIDAIADVLLPMA